MGLDAPTLKEKQRRKSYSYAGNDTTNKCLLMQLNQVYIFSITTIYILFIVPYCSNEVIIDYLYISEIPIWHIGIYGDFPVHPF